MTFVKQVINKENTFLKVIALYLNIIKYAVISYSEIIVFCLKWSCKSRRFKSCRFNILKTENQNFLLYELIGLTEATITKR